MSFVETPPGCLGLWPVCVCLSVCVCVCVSVSVLHLPTRHSLISNITRLLRVSFDWYGNTATAKVQSDIKTDLIQGKLAVSMLRLAKGACVCMFVCVCVSVCSLYVPCIVFCVLKAV